MPNLKAQGYVPDISLASSDDDLWQIKTRLRRVNVVIFFLNDIDCAVCRARLRAFAQDYPDWRHISTEVVAVLPNSVDEVKALAKELSLPFPLLSDGDGRAKEAYTFAQLNHVGQPTVFVVDRYATLYYHEISDSADPKEEEREIFKEVEVVESQCPECGAYG